MRLLVAVLLGQPLRARMLIEMALSLASLYLHLAYPASSWVHQTLSQEAGADTTPAWTEGAKAEGDEGQGSNTQLRPGNYKNHQ